MAVPHRSEWVIMAKANALVSAARDLRVMIDASLTRADEYCCTAPEVVQALREADPFTTSASREIGGAEVAFPEGIAAFEALAALPN